LKPLVRRNGLKLGHDGFPYRWAGFIDEPESSKESRLRAWSVLRQLRSVLTEAGNVAIPPPAQKTFDAEGEALERALTKSLYLGSTTVPSGRRMRRKITDRQTE
jgi:hypothetical protein